MRREWQPTFDAMATPFSAIAGAYATLEDDVLQLYFVFGCLCEVVCWHFKAIFVRASDFDFTSLCFADYMLSRKSPGFTPSGLRTRRGGTL